MSMDYGSMPMHFLAEGDDPPVIMIPEPAGAGARDEAAQDGDEELAADSGSAARPRPHQRPGPGPAPAPASAPDRPERSYECALCEYETSSPRTYLTHLRCVHHERMQIYECPHCTYASRHSQKMQRHVSMVHDPARGERRRPGPPPRERDDYYDDFVNEMHKRQAARIVKKRQQQLLQQEHNVAMAARAVAAAAAAESKPRRSPPTCTVTRSSPPTCTITRSSPPTCTVTQSSPPASIVTRSPLADGSDDDDDDRLVIDQLDDYDAPEDDGGSVVERADDTSPSPPDDGSPQPRASSVITSTGVIRDGLEDPSPGPQHHDHVEPHAFATWPQPQQGGGGRRGVRLERDPVTRAYKCSSCDFTSRAPSLVARHESVVHLKKRFYRCSKCTYVTHIRARFTKHFKYHTMPLIKCDDCDFQSPYRWNLERHVKNHGGSGRYMCRACNFSADIRQSLTVHEMNHHVPPVAHPDDIRAQTRRRQLKAAAAAQLLAAAAAAAKEDGIKADAEDHDPDADRPRRPSVDSGAGGSPDAPPAAPTSTRPPLRCSLCTFRTPFIAVMSKHMSAEHTKPRPLASPALEAAPGQGLGPPPAKRPAKPLPNLIPIGVPLSQVRGPGVAPTPAPAPGPAAPADSTPLPAANGDDAHSADTAKKKNSFFDQLRLYPGTGAGSELVCVHCGHEAKCLSELTRHNKLHQGTSRALGTSTRCQHCRHRCKTSGDLAQHLRTCAKAAAAVAADSDPAADPLGLGDRLPPAPAPAVHAPAPAAAEAEDLTCADMESDIAAAAEANNAAVHAAHPVNIPSLLNDEDDDAEPLYHGQPMPDSDIPKADVSLVGVETAPGYGSVLERTDFEAKAAKENVPTPPVAPKKVFKCPHCSFWAATASRFHVHIVGHANKKPFACSICMYRSNWRWDITKHIKRIKDTKDAKDHSHNEAKILMTDDSGRRNYAKYYRHYLWLNVAEQLLDGLQSLINTYQKQYAGQVNPTSGEAGPALPAPPKLTRAPAPRTVPIPTSSPGALLRPPPPLQAAGQHPSAQVIILPGGARLGPQAMEQPGQMTPQQPPQQSLKRSADTPVPNVGSDPKRSNPEIKKTVWRCKQCHFRDGDRAVVLAHVKGHYRQQQEAFALAKLKNSQASGTQESNVDTQKRTDPEQTVVRKVPFRCDVCPYVSLNETTFQAHVNCHKERNDVLFKCFYCPFYVSTKEEVIQHMTVHQTSVKPENSVPAKTTAPQPSSNKEPAGIKIHIKKEAGLPDQDPSYSCNEVESPNQPLRPPPLDFTNMTEAPVCWVFRDEKLQKMLRCRFCPHVNLRKANMQEHEKMHLKRASLGSDGLESTGQYTQYHCPDCSYVCNNAGVLSTHTRVHSSSYPLSYTFYDPYRNEILQMKEIMEKYSLKPKIEETPKSSPPKEAVDTVNENKLCGINVMSLLDPNQSLTDAVLAMKKKFNLELDGEPFAEPVEDSAESPPCSPLKPLNDGSDPIATDTVEEKQLHFCNLCPARFLFRKELGIHSRFHNLYLIHKCDHCTYTARQRPHLQAHFKVHTADYQDRTTALMNMYKVNKEFPMPRIVCDTISGNLWIVATTPEYEEPLAPSPKFSCQKCPASFFKTEAYQAHLALHGSNNPHKCRICDYAVKSYGDLVKHMMSHGCRRTVAKKILQGQMEVPASLGGDTRNSQSTSRFEQPIVVHKEETPASDDNGSGNADITCPSIKEDMDEREDFPVDSGNLEGASSQEKSESDFKEKENSPSKSPSSSADTSGSPEFIYPTLCRNGRVKVKKYKCKKCPSAFEKHDQYLVHMNLHGSKQRYKCPHCDYSVKFLANHIQHLRRHKINDDAKESPKNDLESSSSEDKEMVPEDSENIPTPPPSSPTRSAKTTGGKGEKLSVADKQAIMVLQQRRAKRAAVSRESLDKNYWCSHCPYSSPRRDQVESHMRRHVCVSGVRSVYICDHCDYSVPNKHFLRDHCKLHFDVSKAPRPDAYMICNALELFTSSGFSGKNKSKGKIMIFQDKGSNVTSDRFLPPLPAELNDDSSDGSNKIFINPKTFESESFSENGSKDNFDTAESDNYAGNELDNKPKEKSCDGSGKEKDLSEPPAATLTFPEATSHNSGSVVENYILSKAS